MDLPPSCPILRIQTALHLYRRKYSVRHVLQQGPNVVSLLLSCLDLRSQRRNIYAVITTILLKTEKRSIHHHIQSDLRYPVDFALSAYHSYGLSYDSPHIRITHHEVTTNSPL